MEFKPLLVFVACTAAISSLHDLYAQQTITGFEAPESVVKYGNKLFVSNIGGAQANPTALDGNGFISELSAKGSIIQRKFQKAILNGPKGLAIAGSTLYTADINRVVGFNINSGEQVFELSFPDAKLLNDLCTVDDKHLVVSESVGGNVYLINIAGKSFDVIGNINGANGVTYNTATKKLYACSMGVNMDGSGKLYVKDMSSENALFTELPKSPTGVFDGLEMMDNDHLLVTDWHGADSTKGRFVVYNLKDNSIQIYPVDAGPADVHYDKASHTFYLPQMLKNSLLIEDIDKLKEQ
jgi:DNA-binding beta-propeller fold protein YncE